LPSGTAVRVATCRCAVNALDGRAWDAAWNCSAAGCGVWFWPRLHHGSSRRHHSRYRCLRPACRVYGYYAWRSPSALSAFRHRPSVFLRLFHNGILAILHHLLWRLSAIPGRTALHLLSIPVRRRHSMAPGGRQRLASLAGGGWLGERNRLVYAGSFAACMLLSPARFACRTARAALPLGDRQTSLFFCRFLHHAFCLQTCPTCMLLLQLPAFHGHSSTFSVAAVLAQTASLCDK